ncbi:Ribophorin I [Spinellus fusiger]|nr:Ribophorin I [Spinellus fusiger]
MQTLSLRVWLGVVLVLAYSHCLWAAAVTTHALSTTVIPIPAHFENIKVLRVIDLRTPIVHHDLGLRVKNTSPQSVSEYYFSLTEEEQEHLASVHASMRQEPKISLQVETAGFDTVKHLQLYKVLLATPLGKGEEVRLGIKLSYTSMVTPFPAKLPQVARQHLSYKSNVYVHSPYPTQEMKTTLQLPSANIVSYTGNDDKVTKTGNKVVYGPFEGVPSEAYELLTCHYEYLKPLLTVTHLHRDLQVSHWGSNLAVEEHYQLRHDGAELEEPFNRARYQTTGQIHAQTNVVQQLSFRIPTEASDIYYRDDIGNVSTSIIQHDATSTILTLRPRYPLFGGWKYTWYHGYNVGLDQFLRSVGSGRYVLNVPLVENVYLMTIEQLEVKIILPEGARHVQVDAPFHVDSIEHAKHFTNFDTTGHYSLTLRKFNVIQEHSQFIQVSYEVPMLSFLQKPLAASLFIFLLFALNMGLTRISMTIGKTPKSVSAVKKNA